jgi:DNA-binding transcriptional LysR family regulator
MTFQQLQTFCLVVEQKSFVRAAECLYMAQSSVSQQIAALERHFGVALFTRVGKRFSVTPEGRTLYKTAKEIIDTLNTLPGKIKEVHSMGKGRLGIGASSTVSTYLLPSLLRRYKDRYPQIELSVKTDYGFKIIDAVRTGDIDLGLVGHNLNWLADPALKSRPVSRDHLSLIVWPGHEWCGRSLVEPRELTRGHVFIHGRPDSGMRSVVDKFIHQEKLTFESVIEMANHESIKLAVEERIGIALISSVAIRHELETGRLAEVPLNRLNTIDRRFLLVSRAGQDYNAAEKAFVDLLESDDNR